MKRYLVIIVLAILAFFVLLPILWTFATSLKPLPEAP
jgi:ABC-type glycerol-3-phosphate transport system permease component